MNQMSFGAILQQARERRGLDIGSVARRLRIRPDILQAIERSDFERMPPKGYARNMVNAYARFLGLNATEITRLYLDESYAYQVGQARSGARARGNGFNMPSSRGGRMADDGMDGSSPLGRKLYVDDPHRDRRRVEEAGYERGFLPERTHRSSRSAVPGQQYTNFYSGPRSAGATSKLPFIAAAVVILILLVIVVVLLATRGGGASDDVPNVPVSGLNDPVNDEAAPDGEGSGDDGNQPTITPAPTSTTFTFEVADGQQAWVEVYIDEVNQLAEVATGPYEQSFDVTSTLRFVTARPDVVTCTQDGEPLTLTANGTGSSEVTVSFSDVLLAWQEENGLIDDTGDENTQGGDAGDTTTPDATTTNDATNTTAQ